MTVLQNPGCEDLTNTGLSKYVLNTCISNGISKKGSPFPMCTLVCIYRLRPNPRSRSCFYIIYGSCCVFSVTYPH